MKLLIISILIFTFAIFEVANGKILSASNEETERCNDYIDQLIDRTLEENADSLEPFSLTNRTIGFEKKVLLLTYHAILHLTNGMLYGLSTLKRFDDCILSTKDDVQTLSTNIRAGELSFQYDAEVDIMGVGPKLTLQGKMDYFEAKLIIGKNTNDDKAQLASFTLGEIKNASANLKGLIFPFNLFTNMIVKFFIKLNKVSIRNVIETKMRDYISKEILNKEFCS